MKKLPHLFRNNEAWAKTMEASHPEFYRQLEQFKAPGYVCAELAEGLGR